MLPQPAADHRNHVGLLFGREGPPLLDAVPFCEAAPAARRGRVLRDEDRVPAEWRLLAVVSGFGGRKTLRDKARGVLEDSAKPL